jgi:hypothetical protein
MSAVPSAASSGFRSDAAVSLNRYCPETPETVLSASRERECTAAESSLQSFRVAGLKRDPSAGSIGSLYTESHPDDYTDRKKF